MVEQFWSNVLENWALNFVRLHRQDIASYSDNFSTRDLGKGQDHHSFWAWRMLMKAMYIRYIKGLSQPIIGVTVQRADSSHQGAIVGISTQSHDLRKMLWIQIIAMSVCACVRQMLNENHCKRHFNKCKAKTFLESVKGTKEFHWRLEVPSAPEPVITPGWAMLPCLPAEQAQLKHVASHYMWT